MIHVKAYLRIRPATAADARLWLKADGASLTVYALHAIMRSLRARSEIARVHWHLLRHGFAQTALRKGADMGMVQEMRGHSSNAMTRRYAGYVRQSEATRQMPRFSPIWPKSTCILKVPAYWREKNSHTRSRKVLLVTLRACSTPSWSGTTNGHGDVAKR
jgi:hypothetical protein